MEQKTVSPEPAVEKIIATTESKTEAPEAKAPSLYLDAGTFKDEIWANAAVEKFTQLGYHAVLIHKNLLWSHSFQVQVGPYKDPKEMDAARQSLATQGFKLHATK